MWRDTGRLDRTHLLESEAAHVVEQPLAVTEHDRDDVELELVDQPCGQVLLDDVGASTEQHVQPASGLLRLLERGPDPIGDEGEGGASLHLQGRSGMVE